MVRAVAALIERVAGTKLADLLWHLPGGIIDRRYAPKVAEARPGTVATMTLTVDEHRPPRNPRQPYKVLCSDDSGSLMLVFFHAHGDYLRRTLPVGEVRVVSGTVERFGHEIQITHPDHVGTVDEIGRLRAVEPIYPLTAGLSLKVLGKAVLGALEVAPDLDEWSDPAFLTANAWPSWRQALRAAHAPESEADLEPTTPARTRLAYDELLANQLALSLVRLNMRRLPGRAIRGDGSLRQRTLDALPFLLTGSQESALAEIIADMADGARMLRLLQGDVGSGKTVVALLAMLAAVESGAQAALMAPTEILARQHLATIEPLAAAAGLKVGLLTGRDKGRNRQAIVDGLASGEIPIAVGTHALFQEGVEFRDLALAVIDETAPLRRSPAPDPGRQGGRHGRRGDDGDADSQDPHADRLWRHGCLAPARKAGRAPAHRYPRPAAIAPDRRGRGRPAVPRCGRQGLLGVSVGRGIGRA